jgi:hypothetical protein
MPASSAQKVSKHQVHVEIFTTDSDTKLQAFLNNEAGLIDRILSDNSLF